MQKKGFYRTEYKNQEVFPSRHILRREMLLDLYDFQRDAFFSYFHRYSDGILYGLEFKENKEGKLCIFPGALKHKGQIYLLSECLVAEEILENIEKSIDYRLYFTIDDNSKKALTSSLDCYSLSLKTVRPDGYKEMEEQKAFFYAKIHRGAFNKLSCISDNEKLYGLYAACDGYDFAYPCRYFAGIKAEIKNKKEKKHHLDYTLLKDLAEQKPISVSFMLMYLDEAEISYSQEDTKDALKLFKLFEKAIKNLKMQISFSSNDEKIIKETVTKIFPNGRLD